MPAAVVLSVDAWAAHGLHPVRNCRRGRAAELAGAQGERKVTTPRPPLSPRPGSVRELKQAFVVQDADGQAVTYGHLDLFRF